MSEFDQAFMFWAPIVIFLIPVVAVLLMFFIGDK